jgi:hypothetical protein
LCQSFFEEADMSEQYTTAGQSVLDARLGEPDLDGGHERMSHIVLEGFRPKDGEFVAAGTSVVEGIVNSTSVKALCGKVWTPRHDPKRYPICPTCKEIAESRGWSVPAN